MTIQDFIEYHTKQTFTAALQEPAMLSSTFTSALSPRPQLSARMYSRSATTFDISISVGRSTTTLTSEQSNSTQSHIAAADGQFNRIHQVAPMCPHGATWQIRLNFVFPSAHTDGKSTGSAVFAQLMAESPYTSQWTTLSPKTAAYHGEIWTPI